MLAHSLRSASESVAITDLDDNVIYVNEAFRKMYSITDEELVGKPINFERSSKTPPEVFAEILPATLKGGWHEKSGITERMDQSFQYIFQHQSFVTTMANQSP